MRPGAHGVEIGSRRPEEHPHKIVLGGDPSKRLERDGFGGILLHRSSPAAMETLC
jgi:hypothetical protein